MHIVSQNWVYKGIKVINGFYYPTNMTISSGIDKNTTFITKNTNFHGLLGYFGGEQFSTIFLVLYFTFENLL